MTIKPQEKDIYILGISAFFHDSAAALVMNGKVVAAAHEERFTRKKQDDSFPVNAVQFVLDYQGITLDDITSVVFYDKPFLKFERILEVHHLFSPYGLKSFLYSIPIWIKDKLFIRSILRKELKKLHNEVFPPGIKILFTEHHLSHAASAFFPSPYSEAAILTIDGVGEWATTTISQGKNNSIKILEEVHFPHSLGMLYSAFTYYCGFKINSGEYKLMGLAPYGEKNGIHTNEIKKKIKENIVSIKDDGSIALNLKYFDFTTDLRTCNEEKWIELFGIPPRKPETDLSQPYMDMALAIQEVTEEVVVLLAQHAKKITGCRHLVMAGGVALNCVSNEKVLNESGFDEVWIQPASGDAGGALGAALSGFYIAENKERTVDNKTDSMNGSYLGPEYSSLDIEKLIRKYSIVFEKYEAFDKLADCVAGYIAEGAVIGWFQGRMEWGPRALGNRSIIADPRNEIMQKKLNLKIKYREGFRPFAPSVLEEDMGDYFETATPSPYMLFTAPVKETRRLPAAPAHKSLFERLNTLRSDVPAITHLDYSARLQSVSKKTNERYWKLIQAFKEKTGYGMIVNTSFNVRNEPIVCTPEQAFICFMNTEMDYLVLGDFVFSKTEQRKWKKPNIEKEYGLD